MQLTYKEIHKLLDKNIDIYVKTPTGKAKIINKFKKVSDGYIIKYNDNTETKCASSHNMRFNSTLKGATEIQVGDIDDYSHKQVVSKEHIQEQEFYDFEIENQDGLYIQNGIIHHNSGKSLVISIILEYFRQHNLKGILLVPNINLLTQFKNDIKSYNLMDLYNNVEIHGDGQKSTFEKPLTISTWQSMMDSKDKLHFDYVICDECLHPNTRITTIDGDKDIKDIKKDDLVLSFNETTKEYEYKPVVEVHKNLSKNEKVYDVELENGKILTITGNHKVLTQRGWVRADELTVEDDILEIPNTLEKYLKIKSIKESSYNGDTYNLHVQDNHNYFANGVLVHNCHRFASEETSDIIAKSINTKIKLGFTGTLPEDPVAKMTLLGLFGKPQNVIGSSELIDRGLATPVKIKSLIFNYNNNDKCLFAELKDYQKQLQFILEHEKRNQTIVHLACGISQKNHNCLVLFQRTLHGKQLFIDVMKKLYPDVTVEDQDITGKKSLDFQKQYNVYFLNGEQSSKIREEVRNILEKVPNAILIGNTALLSTGVNIKALQFMILASPMKAFTTISQSIGRLMRLHPNKKESVVFDIVDNFGFRKPSGIFWKQYKHRIESSYTPEEFPYEEQTINL